MEFSLDLNSIILLVIYGVLLYLALTLLITPFFRWPLAILLLIILLIELVLYWILRGLIVVLEMFRLCGRSNLDLRYKVRYAEGVSTYDDWASAALQLDVLDEREKWKNNPVDEEYNYVLIMKLVHELRSTRLQFEIAMHKLQLQQVAQDADATLPGLQIPLSTSHSVEHGRVGPTDPSPLPQQPPSPSTASTPPSMLPLHPDRSPRPLPRVDLTPLLSQMSQMSTSSTHLPTPHTAASSLREGGHANDLNSFTLDADSVDEDDDDDTHHGSPIGALGVEDDPSLPTLSKRRVIQHPGNNQTLQQTPHHDTPDHPRMSTISLGSIDSLDSLTVPSVTLKMATAQTTASSTTTTTPSTQAPPHGRPLSAATAISLSTTPLQATTSVQFPKPQTLPQPTVTMDLPGLTPPPPSVSSSIIHTTTHPMGHNNSNNTASVTTTATIDIPTNDDITKLVSNLTNLLQLCIRQNVGGIQNERLYAQTNIGTKSLITTFIEELALSIDFLAGLPFISLEDRLELLLAYRRTFGHNALCLSGGGGLGMYHSGVLRALLDDQLLPQVISGTSAGSLFAAHVCCRTDDELKVSINPKPLSENISFDNGLSLWGKFKHWWEYGYVFDVQQWIDVLRWHTCGDMTFLEAYQKTGRILVITATPKHSSEQSLFLSYVTTPNIVIWSAIMASSSIPNLLPDVSLYEKDTATGELRENQTIFSELRDGSFRSDIPTTELSFYFNTSFFLVSQVNPHISLFYYNRFGDAGRHTASWFGYRGGYLLAFLESALKYDMVKNLSLASEMGLWPKSIYGADCSKLFLQNFSGSTTLVPPTRLKDLVNLLSAPSLDDMHHYMKAGKLMVWRKKSYLSTRLVISKALTQSIEAIEKQIRDKQAHVVL